MHAYSLDLRERIVRAVEAGHARAGVARTFQVSLSTVKRYAAQHRTTGSLAPKRRARQLLGVGAVKSRVASHVCQALTSVPLCHFRNGGSRG